MKNTFKNEQYIDAPLAIVWLYFTNPRHINEITPQKMKFKTRTKNLSKVIYPGLVIAYDVAPLLGINLKWETKIASVQTNINFVDIQQKGPFKIWHHLHTFEQTTKGILMTDVVTYELPFGFIGRLVHCFIVRKEIIKLFEHRTKLINKHFQKQQP